MKCLASVWRNMTPATVIADDLHRANAQRPKHECAAKEKEKIRLPKGHNWWLTMRFYALKIEKTIMNVPIA